MAQVFYRIRYQHTVFHDPITFEMNSSYIAQNGWTAVPIDAGKIFHTGPYLNTPHYINLETIKFPSQDPIILKTQEHVETHLLKQTYNHSMRVYYWCKPCPYSVRVLSWLI